MDENKNPRVISRREVRTWIPGCPLRIKEVRLTDDGGKVNICPTPVRCTERKVQGFAADVEYYDSRREVIGVSRGVKFVPDEAVTAEYSNAAYAEVTITEVQFSDGGKWTNETGDKGQIPPEQSVIWQTDPLCMVIKQVCRGKVDAKYYPDKIDGGWRCACGQINLNDSDHCASCRCAAEWLWQSFDKTYLESQKTAVDSGKKLESAEKIRKKAAEKRIPDNVKMIIILASVALIIGLVIATFAFFIPYGRYNNAYRLATIGEYDKAIDIFTELDDFRDSAELAERFTYEKYTKLTGVAELYMTDTQTEEWYSITEDGVLSFLTSEYEGDLTEITLPDVVDGVVVRELDKSFFLNCDSVTTVKLPATLEIIGEQAFMNCTSLTTVVFGEKVTTVMPRAFLNCDSLKEISIPDSVTDLGQRVFNKCDSLNKVIFGRGITVISAYTFSNCPSLVEVVLTSPITLIGEFAFSGCESLAQITCLFPEPLWTDPTVGVENVSFSNAELIFAE